MKKLLKITAAVTFALSFAATLLQRKSRPKPLFQAEVSAFGTLGKNSKGVFAVKNQTPFTFIQLFKRINSNISSFCISILCNR